MTDNEIVCTMLAYSKTNILLVNGEPISIGDILNLINRKQAEIERLKIKIEGVQEANAILREHIRKAVKEFAERLKEKNFYTQFDDYAYGWVVEEKDIDNLVKEMVGEG